MLRPTRTFIYSTAGLSATTLVRSPWSSSSTKLTHLRFQLRQQPLTSIHRHGAKSSVVRRGIHSVSRTASRPFSGLGILGTMVVSGVASGTASLCDSRSSGSGNDESELVKAAREAAQKVQDALSKIDTSRLSKEDIQKMLSDPALWGQVSFGFCMGAVCGYAFQKAAKGAAVVVGVAFMATQIASYAGYIKVDYDKIEKSVKVALDANNDGKFDASDISEIYNKAVKLFEYGLPAGSGFGVGFLLGLRKG